MLESLDGEREDFARQRIERAWCCYGGQRLRLRGDMGESKLDESRSVSVQGRASVGQQQWAKANGVSSLAYYPLSHSLACDRPL